MMLPARTVSLPNFFTPSRLLSLSRPLRDDPPAFLCAMTKYGPDYLPLGAFLAPLAGAAFFVDGVLAVGLSFAPPFAAFGGASTLWAGGLAAASSLGAGFSVGVDSTSAGALLDLPLLGFAGAAAGASAFGAVSPFGAAAFFCSLLSPIATIFRI